MPKAKYEAIYAALRRAVESGEYAVGQSLPSEHQLTARFGCSRNTVRRAVGLLAEEGYVQSVHGKGVLVIYHQRGPALFSIGSVESLKEAAARNGLELRTRVIHFEELTVDAELADTTGFSPGERVYYVQRVRYLNGEPMILDHNYFLCGVLRNLTPELAEKSVYEYLEQTLGGTIVTTRRRYTVERATELDAAWLGLGDLPCVLAVSSKTFNKEGVMFEYTVSRHRPEKFVFYETAQRRPPQRPLSP